MTELPAYWTAPGGSANQNMFVPIEQVSFGRIRETFCDLRFFNLERSDEDYKALISKLMESGQDVAVAKAFFSRPNGTDEDEELVRNRQKIENLSMLALYDDCFEHLPIEELRAAVKFMDWSIQQESCDLVEEMTRQQSGDPLWFKMRIGRVTASVFKRCVRTSSSNPSMSLLRSIFTENQNQSIPACLHGKLNEANGVAAAIKCFQIQKHRNVRHTDSGLVISPNFPYFAASPDQIITCDCCGKITVEVKCPFKFENLNREEGINLLLNQKQAYIVRNDTGALVMNRDHSYYFQVQMQIFLTNANYGFFVIYASKFQLFLKVHRNNEFWEKNSKKAEEFFENVLGPEIIGHFYSPRF